MGGLSMGYMKGQGATEYLVLLAVVLIIALVSIALLGFFPGLASDARITQSNSYWRGEARPFAILEHSVTTDGAATLIVQNNEAQGPLILTNITVGSDYNDSTAGGLGTMGMTFAPGEQHTISLNSVIGGATVSPGGGHALQVNLTYRTANRVVSTQHGVKTI